MANVVTWISLEPVVKENSVFQISKSAREKVALPRRNRGNANESGPNPKNLHRQGVTITVWENVRLTRNVFSDLSINANHMRRARGLHTAVGNVRRSQINAVAVKRDKFAAASHLLAISATCLRNGSALERWLL